MSRSHKKPFIGIASCMDGAMKKWKKDCNRSLRKGHPLRHFHLDEMPSNRFYVRLNDNWSAPNDGKRYWDDPRAKRK